jgi:hypothetical protein
MKIDVGFEAPSVTGVHFQLWGCRKTARGTCVYAAENITMTPPLQITTPFFEDLMMQKKKRWKTWRWLA